MKRNRSLFLSGFNEEAPLILHCVSRVEDRQFLFGDAEKEMFVKMMREYEKFCGVKVVAHCVMSNHVHLLVEIPPRNEEIELSDAKLLGRLSCLYSEAHVKEVQRLIRRLRRNQASKALRELKSKYTYRMGDISEFMKSLKQRFTRWYNKTHGRRGTLWEERFGSTAVSAGHGAKMCAAYIDLNPLRAGMLACTSSRSSAGDPKDYRWSSYGEAMAGKKEAIAGYERIYSSAEMEGMAVEKISVKEMLENYRMHLAEEGQVVGQDAPMVQGERKGQRFKRRKGYNRKEVEAILEKKGRLSRAEMLRCKTRYFTDGAVIGSKAFVEGFSNRVKQRVKEALGGKGKEKSERKSLSSKMKKVDKSVAIHSYRNLQKDVYGA